MPMHTVDLMQQVQPLERILDFSTGNEYILGRIYLNGSTEDGSGVEKLLQLILYLMVKRLHG